MAIDLDAFRQLGQGRLPGLIGIEVRGLRWPAPTRPGDILRLVVEVLETTASRSRPGWGTALMRWTTSNHHGQPVLTAETVAWVPRRPLPSDSAEPEGA